MRLWAKNRLGNKEADLVLDHGAVAEQLCHPGGLCHREGLCKMNGKVHVRKSSPSVHHQMNRHTKCGKSIQWKIIQPYKERSMGWRAWWFMLRPQPGLDWNLAWPQQLGVSCCLPSQRTSVQCQSMGAGRASVSSYTKSSFGNFWKPNSSSW